MHNVGAIYTKELRSYFNSPMAYIFLVLFALLNGYFFTNMFFLIGQSDMRALFNIVPLVYLFFVPAISMGLISREKSLGTIEVISTLPVNDVEFVVGKYLAAVTLIAVGLLFSLVHFATLVSVGSHIDYGAVMAGYFGLILVGAFYAAVGTFASSATDNQVVSLIVAIAVVITFYLVDKLLVFMPVGMAGILQYLSVDYHLANISRGVVDSRNLVYFASMIWLFLMLAIRVLEIRKWR